MLCTQLPIRAGWYIRIYLKNKIFTQEIGKDKVFFSGSKSHESDALGINQCTR